MTTASVSSIAAGLLRTFNEAGVLAVPDVQVARRVGYLVDPSAPDSVLLAFALTVRALRLGAVALDSSRIPSLVEASLETPPQQPLPWPEPGPWLASLQTSPLVTVGADQPGRRPLRLVDGLLYLERHWAEQELVRRELLRRSQTRPPVADPAAVARRAAEISAGDLLPDGEVNLQAEAARNVVQSWVTVLAGGPGTGKTTTVARALALVAAELGRPPTVALAAPSGRAAARLQEAVHHAVARLPVPEPVRQALAQTQATTVHRLLGYRNRSYARTAADPLPHEVVVVDELSMVSLSLMANLLPAVREDARIILVGDPEQLAPVEAGAVLADITAAIEEAATSPLPLVRLRHTWRYDGEIQRLADLIRAGEPEPALDLLRRGEQVRLIPLDDHGLVADLTDVIQVAQQAGAQADAAARAGQVDEALKALGRHRVLCAHRNGPYGASTWARLVEQWVQQVLGEQHRGEWYVGRPLLVTKNDVDLGIANGDAGIIVATPAGPRAAFARGLEPLLLPPAQLIDVETMHAITIHKAQGSQFEEVTVVLPPLPSALLTRELLYTAVTRATTRVRVVAHPEAFVAAVTTRALRASGLRSRLLAPS